MNWTNRQVLCCSDDDRLLRISFTSLQFLSTVYKRLCMEILRQGLCPTFFFVLLQQLGNTVTLYSPGIARNRNPKGRQRLP